MTNRRKKTSTTRKPGAPLRKSMTMTALDGECCDAVTMLTACMLVLRRMLNVGDFPIAGVHCAARLNEETAPIMECAWLLASAILHRATDPAIPSMGALAPARQSLDVAMAHLAQPNDRIISAPRAGSLARARRVAESVARDDAGTLMHEVALEELDAVLFLATDRDGKQVVAWHPIAAGNAFVELLQPLFETAELFVHTDELLETERAAAHWWFSRWPPTGLNGTAFPARVREQEWFFGDRPALSTHAAVLLELLAPPFEAALPARQHALAEALCRSRSSMFVVRERSGDATTLEDIVDHTVHAIHEHSPSTRYRIGDVGAGRVLHLPGGLAIRSPGMVFFTPPGGAGEMAALAASLRQARKVMGDSAIMIEAVLSAAVFGQRVPRNPLPCRSQRDARERWQELQELLIDAELGHEVPAEDAPPEMQEILESAEQPRVLGFDLDEPMADYASALVAQAGPETRGRSR